MKTAPRILLINYEYPPLGGGAGTATAGIARALSGLGCDVVVLTSRYRDLPHRESAHGFRIVRVPVLRRRVDRATPIQMLTFVVSAAIAMVPLTRRWRPDVSIAFFTIPSGPVAWLLRVLRGVPYIVSLRGGDVPGFEWAPEARTYHRLTSPVLRFLWRRAHAVVANSRGLAKLAQRSTPELPIHVVPNGVQLPGAPAPAASQRAPRLLTMGRLTQQKGIDILFRAMTRLRDVEFGLDIAGDGPDRALLENMARELGLADRVRFLGWVPRPALPQTFGNAAVFVLASRIEGMPNVVLEAMAHGRAVVCTRVFGCDELVQHGTTGLLVDIEDEVQLADALRTVLSDAVLRERMGSAGRARVASEFTWPGGARAYLQIAGLSVPQSAAPAHDAVGA
ncbi:MAG TPA: glycosyltransferase family 4 protein [Longimicrobiales bacterium]